MLNGNQSQRHHWTPVVHSNCSLTQSQVNFKSEQVPFQIQVDKTQLGPFQIQVNNEFIIKQDPIHIQLDNRELGPSQIRFDNMNHLFTDTTSNITRQQPISSINMIPDHTTDKLGRLLWFCHPGYKLQQSFVSASETTLS